MGRAGFKFIVHFSTLFSTTRNFVPKKTELYSLADLTTLSFAISLVTSASVALADCFLFSLLTIHA